MKIAVNMMQWGISSPRLSKNRFLKLHKKVSSHASAFITKLLRAYRKLFKCILNRKKKYSEKKREYHMNGILR